MVPELHGGLLDLIRVLGKLAHSASRTTIICEPFVPFHTSTRYHKNCHRSPSPIETSLKQLRNRPSSFWNPVQPKTYYYNCFNYQNVPARNEHYKEIDDKYEQIKQNKLCYDPPECGDDHINKFLSDSDHGIRHKDHNDRLRNKADKSGCGYQGPAKGHSAHSSHLVESKGMSSRPETSSAQSLRGKSERSAQPGLSGVNSGLAGVNSGLTGVKSGLAGADLGLSGVNSGLTGVKSGLTGVKSGVSGVKSGSTSVKSELTSVKSDPILVNSGSKSLKPESQYGNTESNNARPGYTNHKSESKHGKPESMNVKTGDMHLKPESKRGMLEPRNIKEETICREEDSFSAKPESKREKTDLKSTKPSSKSMIADNKNKSKRVDRCNDEISSNDDQSVFSNRSEGSKSTRKFDAELECDSESQVCKIPVAPASSKKSLKSSKSDVEELKEMIQRLENENLLRYQAMLNLMREMSTKDFCRATCDREASSKDYCRLTGAREAKEVKDGGSCSKLTDDVTSIVSGGASSNKSKKSARFYSDNATTSASSLLLSDSNKSFKSPSQGGPKKVASQNALSAGSQDRLSKTTGLVGNAEMTLHDLMEMSSVIADVVVFETVKELMRKYKYRPPCKEGDDKQYEKEEQGTIDSPFETASNRKILPPGKSSGSTKKSYNESSSSRAAGKNVDKSSLMEEASVSREPFVDALSASGSNRSKHQLPTMPESVSSGSKIPAKKGPEGTGPERESAASSRSKTLDRNPPQAKLGEPAASKSENLKSDHSASESRRNPACPKHGNSPARSSAASEFQGDPNVGQNVKSSCRKFDTAPPTKPEGRPPSPCASGRPRSHQQDNMPTSVPGEGPEMRQSGMSTCRKFDNAPPTKTEIRPSPCADPAKPGATDPPKGPKRDASADYTDGTVLYFTKTTKNAFPPQKDTPNAAGFMLRSAYDYTLQPRSIISVKTDLVVELPPNSYGRLAPRNCLTKNFGINVIGDVIDRDYDDTVTVVLINHSDAEVPIKRGAKIAQLIVERIYQPTLQEKKDQSQSK